MNDHSTRRPAVPAALELRYGAGAKPATGPWNETLDSLLAHRSVRGYRGDDLPEGTLQTLVAAAQSAATSSNMQVWSVVAIRSPETKARLAKIAGNQKHIEECPLFLAWLVDLSRLDRLGKANGVSLEGLPYTETFIVGVVDAALAAQNAVVAAESLGLSTVYIGALRNDPEAVARELGLPKGAMAVFGLCVGYARDEAVGEVKPRLPQDVVLHHERYDASAEGPLIEAYDATLEAFSERQNMGRTDWTGRMLARVNTAKSLMGRDRIRTALAALGFPLK